MHLGWQSPESCQVRLEGLSPAQLRPLKQGESARRGQKGLAGWLFWRGGKGEHPYPGEWDLQTGPGAAQVEVRWKEQGRY